jgi:probable F420-dependent oxidoreductase
MTDQQFRFGIGPAAFDLTQGPAAWPALARRVEDFGYSSLNVGDHPAAQIGSGAGPFALLTSAAASTSTLRVGALVLGADFRPAVVAQEALAIQYLSGGRLELGVGAGWAEPDYTATGVSFDAAPIRIARLEQWVGALRAVLRGNTHYDQIGSQVVSVGPNPLADLTTPPPIVLGGGGRRMLELAARTADILTLNVSLRHGLGSYADATEVATDEKVAAIVRATPPGTAPREVQVFVHAAAVTERVDEEVERVARLWRSTPEAVRASPHALIGPSSQLVEVLIERRSRWGISYVTWSAASMESMAPVVERLAGQ